MLRNTSSGLWEQCLHQVSWIRGLLWRKIFDLLVGVLWRKAKLCQTIFLASFAVWFFNIIKSNYMNILIDYEKSNHLGHFSMRYWLQDLWVDWIRKIISLGLFLCQKLFVWVDAFYPSPSTQILNIPEYPLWARFILLYFMQNKILVVFEPRIL